MLSGERTMVSGAKGVSASRRSFLRKLVVGGLLAGGVTAGALAYLGLSLKPPSSASVSIPAPSQSGSMSVEEAIIRRRSLRTYKREPISSAQLSQLLWAAQGITDVANGFRSAPSAGALYPLEVYAVVRNDGVDGLSAGVYHYETERSLLTRVKDGDYLRQLQAAALDQDAVGSSAVTMVICALFERTTSKYGQRGVQYVFQESGHAAQNMYLQATALHLGMVVIGAFSEAEVAGVVGSKSNETPVYVVPVGVPA